MKIKSENSIYELTRNWWNFAFENPEKIKPIHTALYMFSIEHCNRLAWKHKFGLPTTMAMEAIGIKSYKTYINAFNDLAEWGFIKVVERSKNQYSSNVIALVNNAKAHDKALDKAMYKHGSKQDQSTVSIDIPNTYIPNTSNGNQKKKTKRFVPPTVKEVSDYCKKRNNGINPQKFVDFYQSKGWKVGKVKMQDWKASVRTWENKSDNNQTQQTDNYNTFDGGTF